jgi:hypothetical protein
LEEEDDDQTSNRCFPNLWKRLKVKVSNCSELRFKSLSKNEWGLIFQNKKNIYTDFSRGRIFTSLFGRCQAMIDDSTRGMIWIKLLKAEDLRNNAEPNCY